MICVRHVCPQTYEVHEDCIGLYSTNETNADQLTCLIKDVLIRSNPLLCNCRGQCYDGAANMSGRRTGVATPIQQVEPRAVYLHCMGHSLNLAVQDTCRSIRIMRDAFDTVLELSKLFKYSAKKKAMLLKLKSELSPQSPGVKPLCPTRWTVRAESLRSVLLNYKVIQSALEEIVEQYSGNTKATSQARGILVIFSKFSFFFGVAVAEKFFSITDTLSRAIQKKSLCACAANKMAEVTISSLKHHRSDTCFKHFYEDTKKKASDLRSG